MFFLYWFAEQPIAVGLIAHPYDKLVHAAMGAGLAFLLWFMMSGKFAWLNVGLVALFSGLEEWHQSFLPGRVPDFYDFLAAVFAAFLSIFFMKILNKKQSIL